MGLTMAAVELEDSVSSRGRTSMMMSSPKTARYGMVTQVEMDGEELMSDHDDHLIGNHSEMIQLAIPGDQETTGGTGGRKFFFPPQGFDRSIEKSR